MHETKKTVKPFRDVKHGLNRIGGKPVSYTHLDVYKRQYFYNNPAIGGVQPKSGDQTSRDQIFKLFSEYVLSISADLLRQDV